MKCLYEGCIRNAVCSSYCSQHYEMLEEARIRVLENPNKALGRDKEDYMKSNNMNCRKAWYCTRDFKIKDGYKLNIK